MSYRVQGWSVIISKYATQTIVESHISSVVQTMFNPEESLDTLIAKTKDKINELGDDVAAKFIVTKSMRCQIIGAPDTSSYGMSIRYVPGKRWVISVNEPHNIRRHLKPAKEGGTI